MDAHDSKSFKNAPVHTKVKVLGGQFVPKTLYEKVAKDAPSLIATMRPGMRYRLQDMYGDDRWLSLGNVWVRRKAGRAFAFMVATGILRLRFNPYKRSATKFYSLPE